MRYFNKIAAIWTLLAIIAAFVIATVASIIENQGTITYLGALIYGTLGLFASLLTGLTMRPSRRKHYLQMRMKRNIHNINENEKENDERRKNENDKAKSNGSQGNRRKNPKKR